MKKYYFVTYEGIRIDGDTPNRWQEVIDVTPPQLVLDLREAQKEQDHKFWIDFHILMAVEITESEYNYFKKHFG